MSTPNNDSPRPDEGASAAGSEQPRYGRRLPEGERPSSEQPSGPPSYGQPAGPPSYGQGGPSQQGMPGYGQQGQEGYGQQGYGQAGQEGYGQAGYAGSYGGAPQGPKPKRKGAVITLVIGAILMILGPVIGFAVVAAGGAGAVSDIANNGETLSNAGTVNLPANVERVVYRESISSSSSFTCEIADPNGSPVSTGQADTNSQAGIYGVAFTTGEAGSYTVDCDLPSGDQTLLVSPPLDIDGLIGAGLAFLVGLGVGFIGFVLLIIGIIWLVRANKKIRNAQQY